MRRELQILVAVCCQSCAAQPVVGPPELDAEVKLGILIACPSLPCSAAEARAAAADGASGSSLELDGDSELLFLGYRCGSLERLGLSLVGGRVRSSGEVRKPDQVFQARFVEGSASPWVPIEVTHELVGGVRFRPWSPCPRFRAKPLEHSFASTPTLVRRLPSGSVIVGSPDGLVSVDRSGVVTPVLVGAPAGASWLDRDGWLWLYGGGGALVRLRADLEGSLEVMPSNPFWRVCATAADGLTATLIGQQYAALEVAEGTDRVLLFGSSDGAIVAFDIGRASWRLLREGVSAGAECPFGWVSLAGLDDARGLLVAYYAPRGIVVSARAADESDETESATAVGRSVADVYYAGSQGDFSGAMVRAGFRSTQGLETTS
ncbi:MAG: hypothetical protein HYV07_23695 [Deltaproteobacteria bacterium]|nr:hypothetical protein [Deltaproteobacteria bacterium]